jgi:hypothetical protein
VTSAPIDQGQSGDREHADEDGDGALDAAATTAALPPPQNLTWS